METKLIEIRDRGTCISAVVVELTHAGATPVEHWLLGKQGWGIEQSGYYLIAEHTTPGFFGPAIVHSEPHRALLQSGALGSSAGHDERFWLEAGHIPGADGDTKQRDYCVPLLWCAAYWPTIESGQLVDVRVILGEEAEPCESDFASESAERKSYVLGEEAP